MLKKIKLMLKNQLMTRILFTFFIIVVFIVGRNIPIPFLPDNIKQELDVFKKLKDIDLVPIGFFYDSLNLLSLSIYPYLTVSIFMQLAQKLVPYLKELREQGEIGRHKLNRFTRCSAILLAFVQSYIMLTTKFSMNTSAQFCDKLLISFFLTSGTAICIWFADLITSKGVGNGFSLLIMVGISKGVIKILQTMYKWFNDSNFQLFFSVFFLLFFILVTTIIVYLAYLKIIIVYSNKRGQVDNYIPLKINSSGVLPIILVSTLQSFFAFLWEICQSYITFDEPIKRSIENFIFMRNENALGFIFFVFLIILFSFFIAFLTVNPNDIAEHLSKQDAYIENVRPGKKTINKISYDLFRITVLGVFFMILLFSLPKLIPLLGSHPNTLPLQIGGTSFLIIVGVAIETLQQISSTANKENYSQIF